MVMVMVLEKILSLAVIITVLIETDAKSLKETPYGKRTAVVVNGANELEFKRSPIDGSNNSLTRKINELKEREIMSGNRKERRRSDHNDERRQMYSDFFDDAGRGMYDNYWDI